ncbi:MAG: hypothetical protein QNJ60_06075 [Xenococcaceae cyanobacterium MO_188.B19]|nr:hypothetical protein [Xenococcaceae cyanobacterium MO_188.B19]
MNKPSLESDQSAYLLEAIAEVAKELNFKPETQADLALWLESNYSRIIEAAIFNQRNLINKVFGDEEVLDKISEIISTQVYSQINPE